MSSKNDADLARKLMRAAGKFRMLRGREAHHGDDEVPAGHARHPRGDGGSGRRQRHRMMGRERILVILSRYPEGVHQKDIRDEAGIGPSSLSELISKLESDGYIERKTDPADKRATLLFLTEKGKARAAEVTDERGRMFDEYFKNLSEEEKRTLSELLDKILS